MNERLLRFRELAIINERGENLGVLDTQTALALSRSADLDLVIVNATSRPPVAKIQDFGKSQYEQEKRERISKKVKPSELKSIRMRPGTDDHDIETKMKNVIKFLKEGHKVKLTVMFRSREITRPERGRDALLQFIAGTADIAVPEKDPRLEGRQMHLILLPKPGLKQQLKQAAKVEAKGEGLENAKAENEKNGGEEVQD